MPAAIEYGITHQDVETILSSVPGIVDVVPARIIRENPSGFVFLSQPMNSAASR